MIVMSADKKKNKKDIKTENWSAMVELAGSLAESIRKTSAYTEYMAARERLNRDEANRQVLEHLREQQYSLEEDGELGDERRQHMLDELYMAVSLNPVVSDYLNAEYKLDLMMSEIRKAFGDLFDFEEEYEMDGDSVGVEYFYDGQVN